MKGMMIKEKGMVSQLELLDERDWSLRENLLGRSEMKREITTVVRRVIVLRCMFYIERETGVG